MVAEVLRCLRPGPGDVAVDCTLGGGGHAQALERTVSRHKGKSDGKDDEAEKKSLQYDFEDDHLEGDLTLGDKSRRKITGANKANSSTTGITTAVWATNPRPDSHSSTPSHQLRMPLTWSTLRSTSWRPLGTQHRKRPPA